MFGRFGCDYLLASCEKDLIGLLVTRNQLIDPVRWHPIAKDVNYNELPQIITNYSLIIIGR